jgi:4-hydroxy-tetrahydrodipicolinate synthase
MAKLRVDWHGSFAVIVTPFAKDGQLDEKAYRKVVEGVIEAGCHGVIAGGSTGEFFLMSTDERKRVHEIAVDQAKGRIPVLCGPAGIRTEDVVEIARHAKSAGCAGGMTLTPLYVGLDDREVVEFYKRVAGESGLPIMLYNSPRYVKAVLTPELVAKLARIDGVVAIKDTSFDMFQMNNLCRTVGDEIRVFVGLENLFLPALAVGAVGCVAMVPQVIGKKAVDLYTCWQKGDIKGARAAHEVLCRVYDLFNVGSGYIAIKESMNLLGKLGGYSRPPMLMFTDEQKTKLRAIYEDVGLLSPADTRKRAAGD